MQFQHITTCHGTPLHVMTMPYAQSVAVGILVYAGTRDERWPQEAGIAHALEHMVFKGNAQQPNSKAITEVIEACGGNINASTCKEMTFFHRTVPRDALAVAVHSLACQVTSPLFRAEDIASEMKNVVQEIRMRHDEPTGFCYRRFEELLFSGHPLEKTTLGTEEAVRAFGTEDFVRFHRKFYGAENYEFIVVGNVSPTEVLQVFDSQAFTSHEMVAHRNVRETVDVPYIPVRQLFERDIKQAHVYLGVRVGNSRDPETKALNVFRTMVGGGVSFPLFQEVRDKRGLCYRIAANVTPWNDTGEFSIYIGTDPGRIQEAWSSIHEVLATSSENADLFEKARKNIIGQNAVNFDVPEKILRQAAFDILFEGAPKSPREIEEELQDITFENVQRAANVHVLDRNRYTCACIAKAGTELPVD